MLWTPIHRSIPEVRGYEREHAKRLVYLASRKAPGLLIRDTLKTLLMAIFAAMIAELTHNWLSRYGLPRLGFDRGPAAVIAALVGVATFFLLTRWVWRQFRRRSIRRMLEPEVDAWQCILCAQTLASTMTTEVSRHPTCTECGWAGPKFTADDAPA